MYRVVAIDSRKKRDGAVLDMLGTFNALNSSVIQFNQELYDSWISKGAIPSDTVKKVYRLFKKEGITTAKPVAPAPAKAERPAKKKVAAKAPAEKAKAEKAETAEQPEQAPASEETK